MSKAPEVSWYHVDGGNMVKFNAWNIGKINAGDESETQEVYLWNNFNGKDPTKDAEYLALTTDEDKAKYVLNNTVSDMQDVQITTTSDDESCDVVKDTWIQVQCESSGKDSEGEDLAPATDYTPIGGSTSWPLSAQGMDKGCISGKFNSGSTSADVSNFAKFKLKCVVPPNAPAGPRSLWTRIIYYYT